MCLGGGKGGRGKDTKGERSSDAAAKNNPPGSRWERRSAGGPGCYQLNFAGAKVIKGFLLGKNWPFLPRIASPLPFPVAAAEPDLNTVEGGRKKSEGELTLEQRGKVCAPPTSGNKSLPSTATTRKGERVGRHAERPCAGGGLAFRWVIGTKKNPGPRIRGGSTVGGGSAEARDPKKEGKKE